MVESGRVFVSDAREGIEAASGRGALTVEVRRGVGRQVVRQVERDKARERRIGVEIQSRGVGNRRRNGGCQGHGGACAITANQSRFGSGRDGAGSDAPAITVTIGLRSPTPRLS